MKQADPSRPLDDLPSDIKPNAACPTVTQLETLISDFCKEVAVYFLVAEERQRLGEDDVIYILPLESSDEVHPSPGDGAPEHSYAEWTAVLATSILELGKELVQCLESQGIDSKELRRFQRAVQLWQLEEASSLWDELELDLEGIPLRFEHGAGAKPAAHSADEPPAERTKKKAKRRKRGRPRLSEKERKRDARVHDAWFSGKWTDRCELARAEEMTEKELDLRIDRERKRRSKDAE